MSKERINTDDEAKKLGEEFADKLVDYNVKLIKALEKEEYEVAANFRDSIRTLINQSIFVMCVLTDGSKEEITDAFNAQNEYVYKKLSEGNEKIPKG